MNINQKTLLIDFETSPNIGLSWGGKWEVNIIDFIEEGRIISLAYKWFGQRTVHCITIEQFGYNHKKFITEVHKIFNEAEIIMAHNGDNFDIKMANREFIKEGFMPPSPYKTIDTLKMARRFFKFTSNKLDDLGEFLGVGRKIKVDKDVWKGCMARDPEAWKKMARYNKQDVVLLENVYLKLRAWNTSHPTLAVTRALVCPICGGEHLVSQGWKRMKMYKRKQWQCLGCGSWHCDKEKVYIENKLI